VHAIHRIRGRRAFGATLQSPPRRGPRGPVAVATMNMSIAAVSVGLGGCAESSAKSGRGLGAPRQIPPDSDLANIDTELEQFAMDARRAPERGGRAHPADQVADFGIGSSRTA
jgi:hypothetical protein